MSIHNSILINIIVTVFIGSTLISLILSFITGRYFDKLLESKKLPTPLTLGIMPLQTMNRASLYAGFIMWNGPKKRPWKTYRDQIGNFNFRTHARLVDYVFVILCMISVLALIWLLILIW